jgi:hypothetical protein
MRLWKKLAITATAGFLSLTGCCVALPHWTDPYRQHRPAHAARKPGELDRVYNLESFRSLPIVYLRGTPYEIGWQRGDALRDEIQAANRLAEQNIDARAAESLPIPLVNELLVDLTLWKAHETLEGRLDDRYKAELRGMADASGVSLRDFKRHLAVSELFAASCSSFAAMNTATEDGRLIQTRNLDWAIESNAQDYAVIEAVKPSGRNAYISVTFAGFPGVLSGINEHGICVSEIGAGSAAKTLDGTPMVFLLRKVLEEAQTLDQAVAIVRDAPRTGGFNYIIGSAKERTAVALETNAEHCAVFTLNDSSEVRNQYARPLKDILVRGAWAVDERIRDRQEACGGDPAKPGCEPPHGSGYRSRYKDHSELLGERIFSGRKIDLAAAFAINKQVAMDSNIQSIVYDFDNHRMYVRIARHHEPRMQGKDRSIIAAEQPPFIIELDTIFRRLNQQ